MRAYEIQTYHKGRWKIDAVFDDRSLALFEAKRMDEGNRFSGVRVVEEVFDEASQETLSRTIFRGGRAEAPTYKDDNKPSPARAEARAVRGGSREHKPGGRKRAKPKKSGFLGPLLILGLLLIAGVAGLLGLQHLFKIG